MIDLHNDLITFDKLSFIKKKRRIKKDEKDGAKVCYALFLGGKGSDYLNAFSWAKSLKNISIEDIGGIDNIYDLQAFSPKYVTLTWNYDNQYGGGAFGDGGLTEKGKKAIDILNENNVALDLSHLNRKTFFSAIEKANRALVSHACLDKVCSHKRNLIDEQISLIEQKNGVVGLTFVSGFLTKNEVATVDDVVRHVDYFCCKFSYKTLAIGTDFFGTDNGVKGINSYADFYKLERKLEKMGYEKKVIDAIFTRNAHKFLDFS